MKCDLCGDTIPEGENAWLVKEGSIKGGIFVPDREPDQFTQTCCKKCWYGEKDEGGGI